MLHEIGAGFGDRRARATLFGAARTRRALAIARASMPEGRFFAGAGTRAVEKVEQFLALSPPSVARGYRAMLLALDGVGAGGHRARAGVAADGDGAGAARALARRRLSRAAPWCAC